MDQGYCLHPDLVTSEVFVFGQGQGHDTRLHHWLASFGMEQYAPNFLHHGYDLPTATRVSPADLSAIRVVNPAHRKVISDRAAMLKGDPSSRLPYTEQLPRTLWEWLHALGLDQYTSAFAKGNVDSVEKAAQTTWEDLQVSCCGWNISKMLLYFHCRSIIFA